MTADVSQDRRVTVLVQGSKRPALSEGSRLCWALPSPVHERSGYRASHPTGYKVMRSSRIVIHGPVLASARKIAPNKRPSLDNSLIFAGPCLHPCMKDQGTALS